MFKNKRVLSYLWPLIIGVLLLPIPLLRDVHLESAILFSTLFCFIGALKASNSKTTNDFHLLARLCLQLILILIPLIIHGLIANCLTWVGVGYWLILPLPSILFGIAIGRFYRILAFPVPRLMSFITLLLVAVGILAYEFFTLPQVYYFNHVWGAWPGPIYDQEIEITAGLLWFRLSTLLWICLIWMLPSIYSNIRYKILVPVVGVLIIAILFFQPQLGISTPRSTLKAELNQSVKTEHFHLYFDSDNYNSEEIEYWAARHEFHFEQIVDVLEIDWSEGGIIESYLYSNAWQKKDLVGAKLTSYVPVWLEQDQLHIAKEHLEPVLKHELVHVISKQFGNDLINASWSIGLIEGVAEAIAKDASGVSTLDQIIAAEDPLPTTNEMASALSTLGFYGSASSISYTTAGSFVSYLLENYPVQYFKAAYPQSDFEGAYQIPFDSLVTRWKAQLPVQEIDSVDAQISQLIFSQQSLFQMNCPRKMHPILQGLDDLRYFESIKYAEGSLETVDLLFAEFPDVPLVKQLWATHQLRNQLPENIISNVDDADSTLAIQLMSADAFFFQDEFESAQNRLNELQADTSYVNDLNAQDSFTVRSDSTSWSSFVNARYLNKTVTADLFAVLPVQLQWLLVDRAISNQSRENLSQYSEIMLNEEVGLDWFDTQESLINKLVYYGEYELAQNWIDYLLDQDLRERQIERVLEQQEWLVFYEDYQ